MWFLLGIVPLAAFLGWRWGPGATPHFERQARRHGDVDWWLAPGRNDDRAYSAIGVRASPGFDFALRGEVAADRRGRQSGVLAELQVGDPAFDRAVFIESDDPLVARALGDDAGLRDGLRGLLARTASSRLEVKEIRGRGDWLWIQFRYRDSMRPELLAPRVVPLLAAFANRLRAQPRTVPLAGRDPFVRRAAWVLGVHVALCVAAFTGVLLLVLLRFTTSPVLDPSALVVPGLLLGVLLHAGWMAFARRWLGRSSRARLVGMELLLVGTLATPLATTFALREANVWFDVRPGVWNAYLEGKVFLHARRRSVTQWWVEPGEPAAGSPWRVRLPIDGSIAARLRAVSGRSLAVEVSKGLTGTRVLAPFRARIRPGLFGAEWLADIESLPESEAARLQGPASSRSDGEGRP